MDPLLAIIVFGLLMAAIALVGSLTLLLEQSTLQRLLLPLVALSSGSLIGGALFHMIPASVDRLGNGLRTYVWIGLGFVVFMGLEQVLQWHHCHRSLKQHTRPIGYLILIADGLHNFIGGLSIGAIFISDIRLGMVAWAAAAAHEVPQELGDFGVLVNGGWSRKRALAFNLISGLTFLIGGLAAYFASAKMEVDLLIPFGAGNFLYIGAADLIPEFRDSCEGRPNIAGSLAWLAGMGLVLIVRMLFHA